MKYLCPHCNAELSEEIVMLGKCHYCKRIIHPESIFKSVPVGENKSIQKQKSIKYKCPECSVFLSEENFLSGVCPHCRAIIHFDMIHNNEETEEDKKMKTKEYKCSYCNTKFSVKIYADYEVIHIASIQCPACKQHINIDSDWHCRWGINKD